MSTPSYVAMLRKAVGHQKLIVPGVNAIVQSQHGEVLLQERTDFGVWGLPGGSVEIGESVWDALNREVKEETGLTVINAKLFALYTSPRYEVVYPNGDMLQNFVAVFDVTKWSGEVRATDRESLRLGFFRPAQIPSIVEWHTEILEDFARWDGQVVVK